MKISITDFLEDIDRNLGTKTIPLQEDDTGGSEPSTGLGEQGVCEWLVQDKETTEYSYLSSTAPKQYHLTGLPH